MKVKIDDNTTAEFQAIDDSSLDGLINSMGEKYVIDATRARLTPSLRNVYNSWREQKLAQAQIDQRLVTHKPAERGAKKSPEEKLIAQFRQLSPEKQAELRRTLGLDAAPGKPKAA